MKSKRRKFLKQVSAVCLGGIARVLGKGVTTASVVGGTAVTTATTAAATSGAVATGVLGTNNGVRTQVFEVIVRQATAGAPWKEICKGAMTVNGITEEEVIQEVERRQKQNTHTDEFFCHCNSCIKMRMEKYLADLKKIDAIPHSETSPCACIKCRAAVNKILEDIRGNPNE